MSTSSSLAERAARFATDTASFAEHQVGTKGSFIGVECEFCVLEDGRQIDFRDLIHRLAAEEPGLMRHEVGHRYHLHEGIRFYSDGWYAELATPPILLSRDAPSGVSESVGRSRNWLLERLARYSRRTGRYYAITGSSMHLNIQAPPQESLYRFARRFGSIFGPLFVFMTSFRGSAGILIRPRRPRRLEVATEFVADPDRLRACLTLLAGSVMTLAGRAAGRLPALAESALEPGAWRPGWDLRRLGVSPSLIEHGRAATVTRADGGTMPLADWLMSVRNAMEPFLRERIAGKQVRLASEFISGARLGGIELPANPPAAALPQAPERAPPPPVETLFAGVLRDRNVGAWSLVPALMAWQAVLLRAQRSDGAGVWFNLPRELFSAYAGGDFDRLLETSLDEFAFLAWEQQASLELNTVQQMTAASFFTEADLPALVRELEQTEAAGHLGKKPLKKYKCQVTRAPDGKIFICVPQTRDPQFVIKPGLRMRPPSPEASGFTMAPLPNTRWITVFEAAASILYSFATTGHRYATTGSSGTVGITGIIFASCLTCRSMRDLAQAVMCLIRPIHRQEGVPR